MTNTQQFNPAQNVQMHEAPGELPRRRLRIYISVHIFCIVLTSLDT